MDTAVTCYKIEPGILFKLCQKCNESTQYGTDFPNPINFLARSSYNFGQLNRNNNFESNYKLNGTMSSQLTQRKPYHNGMNGNNGNWFTNVNNSDNNNNNVSNNSNNNNWANNGSIVENDMICRNDKSKKSNDKNMEYNEPIYVNPKQFYRIMRRRQLRTQLRNRMIRENKVQLVYSVNGKTFKYKSRHKHAKRRPRGPDGKWLSKKDIVKTSQQSSLDIHQNKDNKDNNDTQTNKTTNNSFV